MTLPSPKRDGSICLLPASESGFTLVEMVVVVAIVVVTTTWAVPQFTRGIEQSKVDNYTQNLQTGLFNLKNRIQKSSKKCTLFKNLPSTSQADYISPNVLLELTSIDQSIEGTSRNDFLDCPMDPSGRQSETPFRFLQREGSADKDNVEVSYTQREPAQFGRSGSSTTSKDQYRLNNLGTNDKGNDLIFRIRSKKWDQDSRLRTRCIVFSGNGHVFDGTWSYTKSECFQQCPENQNCNRDDRAT